MRAIIKNDLFKIALYFAGTMVVGAALAPGLFYLGKAAVAAGIIEDSSFSWLRELHRILDTTNFQRFFNRAILLAAFLCLVPLVKTLRIETGRSLFALGRNRYGPGTF